MPSITDFKHQTRFAAIAVLLCGASFACQSGPPDESVGDDTTGDTAPSDSDNSSQPSNSLSPEDEDSPPPSASSVDPSIETDTPSDDADSNDTSGETGNESSESESQSDEGSDDDSDDDSDEETESGSSEDPSEEESEGESGDDTEDASESDDEGDSDTTGDTDSDDDCESIPSPDADWIIEYQQDILARLTGEKEAVAGKTLKNRQTSANRDATRDYLQIAFEDIGLEGILHDYGNGSNVWAELPATPGHDNGETLILGAHFDTFANSPGANDNATGVAMVFAAARHLSELNCRTRSTIFVLFDQEEIGLVGSKAFAKRLVSDSVDVHSVHTVDQMGWDKNGDRLIELELPDGNLQALYEAGVKDLNVSIPIKKTATGSTDHSSFRPQFDAIGLTEGYVSGDTTPHYHKSTDTYDTVNFEYLKSTTVLAHHVWAGLVYDP